MANVQDIMDNTLARALYKANQQIQKLKDRICELEGRPTRAQRIAAAHKAHSEAWKRRRARHNGASPNA